MLFLTLKLQTSRFIFLLLIVYINIWILMQFEEFKFNKNIVFILTIFKITYSITFIS